MQWHFLSNFHQFQLKYSAVDKFSMQKINLSFRVYHYLFFSQLRVPESFHCCELLKYKFTISLELNAKAIQVCCNMIQEKKTLIRGLTSQLL